ncbi:MAG: MBL fold metallo-hydrolase RNA specificity domain-containing protein [Armatimonadota bacterium]
MKLTFLGAARTVTGSQYLLEAAGKRLLIDCGMVQGGEHLRHQGRPDFLIDYRTVDALLLTHAHIDHSGNIPLITRLGFDAPVYCTSATADLCAVMLPDSAHIQEEDARHDLRRWMKNGRVGPAPTPLYGQKDVEQALGLFESVRYDETVEVVPGVKVRWRDAGHILGSASLEVWVTEGGETEKIIFSGDIGCSGRPLLRDPTPLDGADYVVMESTYGNRRHEDEAIKCDRLQKLIERAVRNRGHVIIPAFAVGRVQELLFELNNLVEHNLIPRLPIFVDSPLAVSATEISRNHRECFDAETRAMLAAGDDPMDFAGLKLTRDQAASKRINFEKGPMVIIASSGMCTGGRIRHHLQNHLDHGNDTILFVGYQAQGTLGRYLQEGNPVVKLFGQKMQVRARVQSIRSFSAHADADELLAWLKSIHGPKAVFITHGEEEAALDFAALAHRELKAPTLVPEFGETVDLDDQVGLEARLAAMKDTWARPAVISEDIQADERDTA